MSYIEERNYWNDPRVLSTMRRGAYKVLECGKNFSKVELEESIVENLCDEYPKDFPEDFDGVVQARTKFEVCDVCRGSGKTVNPSIDCCGISPEEFAEDPDFHESYMRGDYDIICPQCGGERVMPTMEFSDERITKEIESFYRSGAQYIREVASERMMGC